MKQQEQSDDDLLQFPDLKSEGIPYSRNWLDELIKRKLFPPGRRFVPNGRRHWTRGEVREAKEQALARAGLDQPANPPDSAGDDHCEQHRNRNRNRGGC
jgi:hypothetical protein